MRKPLSPLQAFAQDVRGASDRAVNLDVDLVQWLSVAQAADQMSAIAPSEQYDAIRRANTLLAPFANERPSMVHDVLPSPTDEVARLAEQFRVAAESMEKAGCFEMAFTTVSAICRLTVSADYVTSSLATLHLGRIARQMNELSMAHDCYTMTLATTTRERDAPLAARGHIGLALLHDMRGNHPAARAEYERASALAVPNGRTYVMANQGLMTLALAAGRLADALIAGWALHDATANDFDARTSAISDMAVLAMHAGFLRAARSGFTFALGMSEVPRIRLDTLAGAVRAASRVNDFASVSRLTDQLEQVIRRANVPHQEAFARLCTAESWAFVSGLTRAEFYADACASICQTHGFHEFAFRVEKMRAAWADGDLRFVATANDVPVIGSREEPAVSHGLERLESLAVTV